MVELDFTDQILPGMPHVNMWMILGKKFSKDPTAYAARHIAHVIKSSDNPFTTDAGAWNTWCVQVMADERLNELLAMMLYDAPAWTVPLIAPIFNTIIDKGVVEYRCVFEAVRSGNNQLLKSLLPVNLSEDQVKIITNPANTPKQIMAPELLAKFGKGVGAYAYVAFKKTGNVSYQPLIESTTENVYLDELAKRWQ